MGNPYKDFRDDVAEGLVNERINRLKNGAYVKPFTFNDYQKPGLNEPPPDPLPIKKSKPQRITLRMPWE